MVLFYQVVDQKNQNWIKIGGGITRRALAFMPPASPVFHLSVFDNPISVHWCRTFKHLFILHHIQINTFTLIRLSGIMSKINYVFVFLLIGSYIQSHGQEVENLALEATSSTSFVSDWETLDAINDGSEPTNSGDRSAGAYGNWPNPNSIQWVQYDWQLPVVLASTEVYWFHDGGGILTPVESYIEYHDGTDWVKIGDVRVQKDDWNILDISGSITTQSVRLSFRNDTESTGILEWRVLGNYIEDNEDPSTPAAFAIESFSKYAVSLRWDASSDNINIEAYEVFLNEQPDHITKKEWTTITGLTPNTPYTVSVRALDFAGNTSVMTDTLKFKTSDIDAAFEWSSYPTISYDFSEEYPNFQAPTEILDDCPEVVGEIASDWWVFRWGPDRNSKVSDAAIDEMLISFEHEFSIFRDQMGWPPDRRARNGYKSGIYLFGSGLCTDDAGPEDLGGWQSAVNFDNQNWEIVLASYYPVRAFDPAYTDGDKKYQTEAMIHEGIHSVFAGLPGVKKAAWFHEGSNTYLQREGFALQEGGYTREVGAANFIAPFMPIECYSGWLQDDTFGGPSAEGVAQTKNGETVSSWRNILGGIQYSSAWAIYLDFRLGKGSIPWIWQNSPSRVLDGMGAELGDANMRRLITEYHARQALVDVGPWSPSILADMKNLFNATITSEGDNVWIEATPWNATPYAKTTTDGKGLLTPEYRTTPGWSGANQIPIYVDKDADMVTVDFQPLGENMNVLLCYRALDGSAVYSEPVSSGTCYLPLEKVPANSVVIAVISNTDYIYEGESTRTTHFDYRLQLGEGTLSKAPINNMWFDPSAGGPAPPKEVEENILGARSNKIEINVSPNPVNDRSCVLIIEVSGSDDNGYITLLSLEGKRLLRDRITSGNYQMDISGILNPGIYLLRIQLENGTSRLKKIIVQ